MKPLAFVVPGMPQAKERPRLGKGGHIYTPKRTQAFEDLVRALSIAAAKVSDWPMCFQGPTKLTLRIAFGDNRRRDVDNVIKAIGDGLQWSSRSVGVIADDSMIWELHCFRIATRPHAPQVEVLLEELETASNTRKEHRS